MIKSRDLQTFPVRGEIVNTFHFVYHMLSSLHILISFLTMFKNVKAVFSLRSVHGQAMAGIDWPAVVFWLWKKKDALSVTTRTVSLYPPCISCLSSKPSGCSIHTSFVCFLQPTLLPQAQGICMCSSSCLEPILYRDHSPSPGAPANVSVSPWLHQGPLT